MKLRPCTAQRGFTLLLMLIAIAVAAAASSTVVARWSDENRRMQEQDLLRSGNEIAAAIASYRAMSAGSIQKYPPELEDLLEDRRAFGTLRHLRRLRPDPVTRGGAWGLIRAADGGVMGVYSRSEAPPLTQRSLHLSYVDLKPVRRYADWHFVPRETPP